MTPEELKKLREEHRALVEKMKAIKDGAVGGKLSTGSFTEWDALRRDAAERKNAILCEEETTAEERWAKETSNAERNPADQLTPPNADKDGGTRLFDAMGEQLRSVAHAESKTGVVDPRLKETRATGLSEGTPAEGGFLVQTDFSARLLQRSYQTGGLASRIERVPISAASNSLKLQCLDETSRADGSRLGGIRGYWEGEAATHTKSAPKFAEQTWTLRKLTGLYYATDELIEDVAALGALVPLWFGQEFGFKLDEAIFDGSGAGQPKGILGSNCLVTVAKETGQAAKTVLFENVSKMWSRVWAQARPNGAWFINQDIEPSLMGMYLAVGTGGVPVYLPANGVAAQPNGTLFGRPVVPIEHCKTLGTVGDIVYACLSEYLGIEKGGIKQAASIHVRFLQDETVFRFVYRFDGQPLWRSALTPKNGTNTLSPFVALATRA